MSHNQRGFTLIELLVVISIIGLLASIVYASLSSAKQKGRVAKIQEDAHSILTQIELSRSGTLMSMTGSGCTACAFNTTSTMKSQASALAVNATNWGKLGFSAVPTDPWGSPYTFDENESEFPSEMCRYDMVYSAGPDGIWNSYMANSGVGSGYVPGIIASGNGDDYTFAVNFWTCTAPN